MKPQACIDPISEHNEFMKHNGIQIVQIFADTAVTRLIVGAKTLNPYGMVHGGALFTLMDVAAGVAARTDHRRYVTLSSDLHFCKSARQGVLQATAKVIHRGRTICLVDAQVTGAGGLVLSRGSFTMFCVDSGSCLAADVENAGDHLKKSDFREEP